MPSLPAAPVLLSPPPPASEGSRIVGSGGGGAGGGLGCKPGPASEEGRALEEDLADVEGSEHNDAGHEQPALGDEARGVLARVQFILTGSVVPLLLCLP